MTLSATLATPAPRTYAEPPAQRASAPSGSVADTAQVLAGRILNRDNAIEDAANAVSEAYAWAGIPTHAGDAEVRAAVAPSIPTHVDDWQVQFTAVDARARADGSYRITLDEMGELLGRMGVEGASGPALMSMTARWVADARSNPDSPHSFTPLFLQAMAQGTNPELDLSSGLADPQDIKLSLLEQHLIMAASLRASESYWPEAPTAASDGVTLTAASLGMVPLEQQVCSDALDKLGVFKEGAKIALDKMTSIPVERFYDDVGVKSDNARFAYSKSFAVVVMLVATYTPNFTVAVVHPEAAEQHYSHGDQLNQAMFQAQANLGVVPPDAQRNVFDCMKALGIPVYSDGPETMANWRVKWDARGLGHHATWGLDANHFDYPGSQTSRLGADGEHSLIVDMAQEPEELHQNGGERRDAMSVSAKLDISEPPVAAPLKAVIGDTKDAVLDVLMGWYQHSFGQTATASVGVVYHGEPGAWHGTITFTQTWNEQPVDVCESCGYPKGRQVTNERDWYSANVTAWVTSEGKAVYYGKYSEEYGENWVSKGMADCGSAFTWTKGQLNSTRGEGSGEATVVVSENGDGAYRIQLMTSNVQGSGTRRSWDRAQGFCNGGHDDSTTSEIGTSYDGVWAGVENATVDPNNPNRLSGSVEVDGIRGRKGTLSWELTRE